jgi:hypothetical protein
VVTTRAEITALREREKCHEDRGLLLSRKSMVVIRQRLKVARARQRSSAHQSLKTWVDVSLFGAFGVDSFGSVIGR